MAEKITQKLYGGEVTIDFYPDSHRYKKAGERTFLISATAATGIIDKSRFLIPWAVGLAGDHMRRHFEESTGPYSSEELLPVIEESLKQHTIRKEAAATVGDKVHEYAEHFGEAKIAGKELPNPDDFMLGEDEADKKITNGIGAFLDWYNAHDVEFLQTERLVYSKENDYCGLCDVTLKIDGKKVVGDYKTAKYVYNEHLYQLSGYWGAIEEEDKEKYDGGVILHFSKEDGTFKAVDVPRDEHEKNLDTFLHCVAIKRREKELYRRK